MCQTHSDNTKAKWAFWKWQKITRANDQSYLTRLILLRTPWLCVYLHWFYGNDDLCKHDHPWWFLSLILTGGYFEFTPDPDTGREICRWHPPGSLLFRNAEWVHRVELGSKPDPDNEDKRLTIPAATLVITGPKSRPWGFHTPFGWVPWRQYDYANHCPEE